jgi:hypothetical protein
MLRPRELEERKRKQVDDLRQKAEEEGRQAVAENRKRYEAEAQKKVGRHTNLGQSLSCLPVASSPSRNFVSVRNYLSHSLRTLERHLRTPKLP